MLGDGENGVQSKTQRSRKHRSFLDDRMDSANRPTTSGVRSTRDRFNLPVLMDSVEDSQVDLPSNKRHSRQRSQTNGPLDPDSGYTRNRSSRKVKSPQQRLPRSVSEEVLALEGRFSPGTYAEGETQVPHGSKRSSHRHKFGNGDLEKNDFSSKPSASRQVPVSKSRSRDGVKKRKKPRKPMLTSGEEDNYAADAEGEISEGFPVDQEDIVIASEASQASSTKLHVSTIAPSLPSEPLDVVFIEKKDGKGFARENKNFRRETMQGQSDYQQQLLQSSKVQTSLEFALSLHSTFQSFAFICHGLLAGVSIAQCIFVYSLDHTSHTNFLRNYYDLALPFHSILFLLMALSVVSIMDRYVHLANGWSQFFLRLVSRPSRGLTLVAYVTAFLFSIGLARLDEQISMYVILPHLWSNFDDITVWKTMNVVRVTGSVLGWCFVAFSPMDDITKDNLKKTIEEGDSNIKLRNDVA